MRKAAAGRVVRTASLDSRSAYWDERLRSAQWLDTAKYPEMSYRSTRIVWVSPSSASVEGQLTLHGVTRPLALRITDIDCPEVRLGGARPAVSWGAPRSSVPTLGSRTASGRAGTR